MYPIEGQPIAVFQKSHESTESVQHRWPKETCAVQSDGDEERETNEVPREQGHAH